MIWLDERRQKSSMMFDAIDLNESKEWVLAEGILKHTTGGFFSIGGITAKARCDSFDTVAQPIIFQPEIGILGFVVFETAGEYQWLVQAKAEPGNQGLVQLAPTVQATYSNYMRRHGGAKTQYLSCFLGDQKDGAHSNSLQSEQGTRFFEKFNRNSVRCVAEKLPLKSDMYHWFDSKDLRQALLSDYCVNTDARSVITTAPWAFVSANKTPFSGENEPASFRALCRSSYCAVVDNDVVEHATFLLEQARESFGLSVQKCGLGELPNWELHGAGMDSTLPGAEFNIRYYAVNAREREISLWDQPLVQSLSVAQSALLAQVRNGILQIFLSLNREIGLTGGVEYGPSYQSDCKSNEMRRMKAFLDTKNIKPQLTILQSDEGGRFMKSLARYSIILLPDDVELPNQMPGLWVTLAQFEHLCRAPKLLTNEARSCISLLLGIA